MKIISALEAFYKENISRDKSIDYAFGFFDAYAIVRELDGEETADDR